MKVNKEKESLVSYEYLKSILKYDPENGIFTWLVSRGGTKIGDIAGSTGSHGYVHIQICRKIYKAHRLAFLYMKGDWPEYAIDHINGIKNDNRFCNLREASCSDNQKNRGVRKHSTTGVTGVYLNKITGKYYPYIMIDDKNAYPKCDGTYDDAVRVRKEAEIKHYGEFRYQG